jgi:two-component sensor histidine kinase
MDDSSELRDLFHRLNNQLGVILSHAELLEAKASDEASRARAAQVVASTLAAMGTARDIQQQTASPTISTRPQGPYQNR